jgi:hypothetical protein
LLLPAAQGAHICSSPGAHICSSPAGAHTCCYRPLRGRTFAAPQPVRILAATGRSGGRPGSRSRFTLHSSLDLRSFPPPALSGFRGLHFLHLPCFFGLSSLLLPMMTSWPLAALSGVGDFAELLPTSSEFSVFELMLTLPLAALSGVGAPTIIVLQPTAKDQPLSSRFQSKLPAPHTISRNQSPSNCIVQRLCAPTATCRLLQSSSNG